MSGLNAIQTLVFTNIGKAKDTLGGYNNGDINPLHIYCHCMISYRPSKCCFFTRPSPIPNLGPREAVCVWDKSSPLVKNGGWGNGGIKEAATNFAIIAKERSGVFLDPFVWVLQEWCSFTTVEDNIMFFLSQLVLTTMILWNVPSDTLVGSIHYFGTQFVSLPWNIGLELAKWVVFSRHMEGQRRLWF